ncbi:MAG: glycosyltransferase family 2 protein [Bacteroidales bacterium]|nr:glycosyltransferase family 2 protein [Bacteroidales bacterium]
MNKISAIIISYNEEKNIERCLESIIDVADEIIVLDSFSTDKTEEICRKHNVRFEQHIFDGHIEQKNRVMNMASNDYVLSLDADEFLSNELKNSILKAKENLSFDAYSFNRLNFFCGKEIKHGGWYPDKKIRLWNKNKGKWGGKNPHDKVIFNKDAIRTHLKGDLKHFSFHSIKQHVDQINKFSSIKAENDFKAKKRGSFFKIIFKPNFKFFKIYFLKLGFLDGFYGLVIALNSAHSEFLRQVKLKELNKNNVS